MICRRVFVIWAYPLFYEAVRRAWAGTKVEWVGGMPAHAVQHDQIAEFQPDQNLLLRESADLV